MIGTRSAFIYARVSTDRQAAGELSVPDQIDACERYCAANGLEPAQQFIDAKTGRTGARGQFQMMVELALEAKERPYAIIAHSLSRFFRDEIELELLTRKLAKKGIRLISVTQPFGDDPTANLARRMVALFDEYQSEETAKHVSRTMIKNAKDGFWNGSLAPYGYKTVGCGVRGAREKKRLAVDPVEAEVVRLIYDLYLNGADEMRLGVKAICSHLNLLGYRTRAGAKWGTGSVHLILTRPTYIGRHVYNRRNSRTGEKRAESEQVEMECPEIIPEAMFARVQRSLKSANPKTERSRAVTGPILLTEIARCELCDSAMTLRTGTSSTGRVYKYYACAGHARVGKSKCPGISIPMDRLDHAVTRAVTDHVLSAERLGDLLSELGRKLEQEKGQVAGRIESLGKIAEDADVKLRNLYQALAKGILDPDEPSLKGELDELREKRDTAREAIRRLDAAPAELSFGEDVLARFADLMRNKISEGEISLRKRYLKTLIARVIVGEKTIRIEGERSALAQSLADQRSVSDVRRCVPKWRTRQDSNL